MRHIKAWQLLPFVGVCVCLASIPQALALRLLPMCWGMSQNRSERGCIMRLALKSLLALLVLAFFLENLPSARADYAAIAFSQSTGKYGYTWGYKTRTAAEQAAVARVSAYDARPVVWVHNGYCALALGDVRGAAGWGWGPSPEVARRIALEKAATRTPGAHVVVTVFSGY